ncbi:MAG: oligoendopeptidase F [Candidatus Delongbacteria bacterium]|nr:oligoendopeptidase F [Candidatus Delongbacteria bacterium]
MKAKMMWLLSLLIGLTMGVTMQAESKSAGQSAIPNYSETLRKDIPVEYTWKIEDIYADKQAWDADLAETEKMIAQIDAKAPAWTQSAAAMLEFLNLQNDISMKLDRLYSYASHQSNMDIGNTDYLKMKGSIQSTSVNLSMKLAFVNTDILKLGREKFEAYLKAEAGLAPYKFGIDEVFRGEAHILPEDQQRIVSMTGLFTSAFDQTAGTLRDMEIPPQEVTLSDGSKVNLNYINYSIHRASKNQADRETAMVEYFKNMKKFENTLATLLDAEMKSHFFNAKTHKHEDCLKAKLFGDNIDPSVYHNLITTVKENLEPLHRYIRLKQRMLKLDKYHYYDIYASAVKSVDKKYTWNEATTIVGDLVKPLGADYQKNLKRAFVERWIDIYPNKGKETGAYSGGVYGVHPFVKMNYDGTYSDVSTLAHELGHSMHSFYSNQTQHYTNSHYPIFLAEVASTFNENLLMDYLLKNEKDDMFTLFVLDNYLERFRATVYRQTLFAEFELEMHQMVEQGKTLTADWLNGKYLELTRLYYGHDKNVTDVGDYIQNEWSVIPHFYYNFYVFQYSTGIVASMALTDQVLKQGKPAQERYLGFLKAGSSDFPIEILKKAGVDMTQPQPYQAALGRFDQMVGEMEKIVTRLEKSGKI